jgi:anhydro-N-acetylmuramic acid kinase
MKVIGLMSGTSADGIDVALYEITGEPPQLSANVITTYFEAYPRGLRNRILKSCQWDTSRVDEICILNVDLAEFFSNAISTMLQNADILPSDVDLIGSHGQTIWHNVDTNGVVTATLQITSGSVIAERTGITTVNNFRERDVAAGGQGAPLTGYADWLLLRHDTHWRAVQNIGGMGNVTFLPPLNDTTSQPIAFDTGPGNALVDMAVSILTDGEQTYDADGQMASQGQIHEEWLTNLVEHPYLQRTIPKTTGRELFGEQMAKEMVEHGKTLNLSPADIVATITMFTSVTIADAYQHHAPHPIDQVILGGGGRHNQAMVSMLQGLVGDVPVMNHEDIGLDSDFKEALVFALLAYETWHGRVGCLPSQTGATHATVLGQITPSTNYKALIRRTWCAE